MSPDVPRTPLVHQPLAAALREDPRATLGLRRSASPAEINAAFRRMARAYHPDRSHPFLRAVHAEIFRALCEARRQLLDRA